MLNPLMLLGLLGLAVPIVIHLINRQRMKPQPLATLKFLEQRDVANAFAPVPRDLLQLLLRLLLLALFVLLMARITGPSRTTGPRALAIVLDNSMSMRGPSADGATSLFEAHRARILDLVRGMNQGDFFSFTLVGDKVFESTGFTSDIAVLESAVTNAWVSDGGGRSLFVAIEDTLRDLRSKRAASSALLVFSDQQLRNYRSRLGTPGLADLLRGSRIRPVFIADPVPILPNVELHSGEFHPEKVYLGASGKATAHLVNSSPTQQTVVVSLKSGPVVIASRPCNLASGETARVEIRQTFDSPNDSALGVNVSEDGFNADNDAYTTVRMLKRRQVLLVTSESYPKPEGLTIGSSGPDLFACAINPSEATGEAGGETYISVKRVVRTELERKALSMYSMVVLYGIQMLDDEVIRDLEGYVNQGGGLYIVPDSNVTSTTVFNGAFGPFLAGFELGDLREPKIAAVMDTNEKSIADPLLLDLVRGEWGTVNDILFARYFSTQAQGEMKAALKTRDGDLLLGVAPMGKGQVCVQTHSWNLDDTSLPRNLAFVSVAHAIVDRLSPVDEDVAGRTDHIRVGDFHRMELPQFRGLGGTVTLEGPRTYSFEMAPEDTHVMVKDIYIAGAYRATHPGKAIARDRWLAVNRAPDESDLTVASPEQLAGLCGGGDVVLTSDRVDDLFRPRRELFILLLTLVFVALVAETLFGALFSRGRKEAHESAV
ncbi:MAG: hypothetical protein FJ224_06930 [Lentisphaerae bacterium]|nr:hypothetical protein [Lentisphaerota bacterium]